MSGSYHKRVHDLPAASFVHSYDEQYVDEGKTGKILYLGDLVHEAMRGEITHRGPIGRVRITVEFWPEGVP